MKKNYIEAHSYYRYKCNKCHSDWIMFLTEGIEDGPKTKTAPTPIRCSCGGLAHRTGNKSQLMVWHKLEKHESYFQNKRGYSVGIPILRGKVHEQNKLWLEREKHESETFKV